MDRIKTETYLSIYVLSEIKDKSIESILRRIIFSQSDKLDWNEIEHIVKEEHPECNL